MIFGKGNKKILAGILGIVFFVLGFWLTQAPETEATLTEKEFIRIKIDSTSGTWPNRSQLWNFFGTDNGTVDEFNITSANYNSTYVCGLLLTEEFTSPDDEDYIVWTEKGVILKKSGTLKSNIGSKYTSCCTVNPSGNSACKMDGGSFCNEKVITDSNYVFQKNYGTLDEDKCLSDVWGVPCNGNPATCCGLSENYAAKKYIIKEEALCGNNSKWAFCDNASENECSSDGTNNYACNSGVWENCTSQGKTCSAGACGVAPPPPSTCNVNPRVDITPPSDTATAGTEKSYTVIVTNNNGSSCTSNADKTFNLPLPSGCPGGWTCSLVNTTLTIDPASANNTTLKIKSPATAKSGDNANVTVKATGASGNIGSNDATYTVENCPPNFSIFFSDTCYTVKENFEIDFKVAPNDFGCAAIYQPPPNEKTEYWDETFNNTGTPVPMMGHRDTGKKGYSVVDPDKDTWRVTLNPGINCKYNDGCMDTVEVGNCCGDTDCTAPATCNPVTHMCSTGPPPPGGPTCAAGDGCKAAGCTPPDPDCPAGPSPISAPLCQSALVASDVGKLCGPTYVVTPGDVSANSWCCSAANGVAIDKTTCQNMDPACAAGPPPPPPGPSGLINPLKCKDFVCLIEQIVKFISYLAVPIAVLMIIIAAFLFMTAGGEVQKLNSAKNVITYTLIGLLIIVFARGLVAALKYVLGGK